MGALRNLINENIDRREVDSPMSTTTNLSYSKAYANDDSPMRPVNGANMRTSVVKNLESNPLFVDPKKVLSQLEDERRIGQNREVKNRMLSFHQNILHLPNHILLIYIRMKSVS